MNPSGINSFDKNYMKATFTLTNAAPQFETSNSGPWQTFENKIRKYAKTTCGSGTRGGTLYLLTGTSDIGITIDKKSGKLVQDTSTPLPYTRKMFPRNVRLVTPRAVWTAGCCVWREPGKVFGRLWSGARAQSFAVMSNNHKVNALLHQTEMSVTELEGFLTPRRSTMVNIFSGDQNCRLPGNDVTLPP